MSHFKDRIRGKMGIMVSRIADLIESGRDFSDIKIAFSSQGSFEDFRHRLNKELQRRGVSTQLLTPSNIEISEEDR